MSVGERTRFRESKACKHTPRYNNKCDSENVTVFSLAFVPIVRSHASQIAFLLVANRSFPFSAAEPPHHMYVWVRKKAGNRMHRHVTKANTPKLKHPLLPAHSLFTSRDITATDLPAYQPRAPFNGPCTRHAENVAGEQLVIKAPNYV